jgi:hypothetical protein
MTEYAAAGGKKLLEIDEKVGTGFKLAGFSLIAGRVI